MRFAFDVARTKSDALVNSSVTKLNWLPSFGPEVMELVFRAARRYSIGK